MSSVTPINYFMGLYRKRVFKTVIVVLILTLLVQCIHSSLDLQQAYADTIPDVQAPSIPANLSIATVSGSAITLNKAVHSNNTVAVVSGSSITLIWDASLDNVGAEGYEVYFDNYLLEKTTETSYTYSEINDSICKQFYVKAYDKAGNVSPHSNRVYVVNDPEAYANDKQAPTVPANIIYNTVSGSAINIVWDASTDNIGIEGYEVYKNDEIIGFTEDTSFTDYKYDSEAYDKYVIVAYDLAGNNSLESEPMLLNDTESRFDDISIYKTDRYIVKYKSKEGCTNLKEYLKNRLKSNFKLRNKRNNNIEVITLEKKVKPEVFIKGIKTKKSDKKSAFDYETDIEYIQPDNQFMASSADPYYDQQWGIDNSLLNRNDQTTDQTMENGTYSQEKTVQEKSDDISMEQTSKDTLNVTNKLQKNGDSSYTVDADVPNSWNYTKGEGSIVAVLDTGIDIIQEDIRDNIWVNSDEIPGNNIDDDGNGYIDDVNGWNFADNTNQVHNQNDINDEWHGTHIAGIIAAQGNNNIGITGVAPNATIMPLKVLKNGTAYTSSILSAIEYAEMMGAKIVNCSWSSLENNLALKEAIDNSNMLFICAAGNSHQNIDVEPFYPAAYDNDNIISVASVDKNGILSGFSNYGVNSVDVVAPGEDIISTQPENRYISSSGTSMAAAFVSGEAALILCHNGDFNIYNIKEKILNTSYRLSSLVGIIREGNIINCNNAFQNLDSDEIIQINTVDNNNYIINHKNADNNSYINVIDNPLISYENTANRYLFNGSGVRKADLPEPVSGSVTVELDGKLYVIGGFRKRMKIIGDGRIIFEDDVIQSVYQYNPITDTWCEKSSMLFKRYKPAVAAVNGKIYVFGGSSEKMGDPLNTAEVYYPEADRWEMIKDMPTARYGACTAVVNDTIYVIGGCNIRFKRSNIVEAYYAREHMWMPKSYMQTARECASAAVIDNEIYVMGGNDDDPSMEVYDPGGFGWRFCTSLPESFSSPNVREGITSGGAVTIEGMLFVFNGYYDNLNIYEYIPKDRIWRAHSECLDVSFCNFGIVEYNKKVYIIGGENRSHDFSNFTLVYTAMPVLDFEYVYDINNRLTQIKKSGVIIASFSYDLNGNLLSIQEIK